MLIRFNVGNFLSFTSNDEEKSQEFSMIAGKVRSKKEHIYDDGNIKLLKFAAIYGANAAGKSNLVKAIDFMRKAVVSKLPKGHTNKYCKLDMENKNKKSYFEIEIKLENNYYAYGFEIILNQSKFTSEWLIELKSNNEEKLIFSRDIEKNNYSLGKDFKDKLLLRKLKIYIEDIKSDDSVLFLKLMNQNKKTLYAEHREASVFRKVFKWIKDSLDINYPDRPISSYSYFTSKNNVEQIYKIISAFGTGITDYKMVEVPIENVISRIPREAKEFLSLLAEKKLNNTYNDIDIEDIDYDNKKGENNNNHLIMRMNKDFFMIDIDDINVTCKTIKFSHGCNNVLFDLLEESDGTIRILDLIEILVNNSHEKVYVVDELDRCLHPSLSYKFVETFLKLASKRNIQLIVTTHESRLMDFGLLRRDEIWFVNKEKTGQSSIYSLEEYNTRFDQKIDKAYLEGRYGGVPIFSTVFPIKEE